MMIIMNLTTIGPILTSQKTSSSCKTCRDLMITNGVLGGLPFIVVLVVVLQTVVIRKCKGCEGWRTVPWKYELVVTLLGSGMNLSTVIGLLVNCWEINPEKCIIGYGWIGMACFVILDLVAIITITIALKHRKEKEDKKKKTQGDAVKLQQGIDTAKAAVQQFNFLFGKIGKTSLREDKGNLVLLEQKFREWESVYNEAAKTLEQIEIPEERRSLLDIDYLSDCKKQNLETHFSRLISQAKIDIEKRESYNERAFKLEERKCTAKRAVEEFDVVFKGISRKSIYEALADLALLKHKFQDWDDSYKEAVRILEQLNSSEGQAGPFNTEYLEDVNQKTYLIRLLSEAEHEIGKKNEEISPGKLMSWENDDERFYATNATEKIFREALKKKKVIVSGHPGTGKSVSIRHIALQLRKDGYRLFCVRGLQEMIDKMNLFGEEEKQVYVIDDIFGVYSLKEEIIMERNETYKDDIDQFLKSSNITVLFSTRLEIIQKEELSEILSKFSIVNISECENKLSEEERVKMFKRHATVENRRDLFQEGQLKDEIECRIRHIDGSTGPFPLVCRLFTDDKDTTQSVQEYFDKPLDIIAENLNTLKSRDKLAHIGLLLCVVFENNLPLNLIEMGGEIDNKLKDFLELYQLSPLTPRWKLKKKMDTLLKMFIKMDGETYCFIHDIVYDEVIKHVSTLSTKEHGVILRHCTSKFVSDRVLLSGVVCQDTDSKIILQPELFGTWAEGVLEDISDGIKISNHLYKDIEEGRCSENDDRLCDNPWSDIFEYNHCVRDKKGDGVLSDVLNKKNPAEIEHLMCSRGFNIDGDYTKPRHTALHWAVWWGLEYVVTQVMYVISEDAKQKVESIDGLLNLACESINMNEKILEISNEQESDVIDSDVLDSRSLFSMSDSLLKQGADANMSDVFDLFTDTDKRQKLIKLLLDNGVDVNMHGKDGNAPLHKAICKNDYSIVELLLKGTAENDRDVNVNQLDAFGNSPLFHSLSEGYTEISDILKSKGAHCIYKTLRYEDIFEIPDIQLSESDRKKIKKLKDQKESGKLCTIQ